MEDEDDLEAKAALDAFLDCEARADAKNRALAVHEAGHTVVARALGAEIVFVEIDLVTGNGGSRSSTFDDDQIKNLAVCVAGCRAEHLLDARDRRLPTHARTAGARARGRAPRRTSGRLSACLSFGLQY